jgi:hypothetical protein
MKGCSVRWGAFSKDGSEAGICRPWLKKRFTIVGEKHRKQNSGVRNDNKKTQKD